MTVPRVARSDFADAGTCEDWTPVHGILEGYSTASIPKQDVWNVSCVGGSVEAAVGFELLDLAHAHFCSLGVRTL